MIILKTPEQMEIMDEANKIVHHILDYAENVIKIDMTSKELDTLVEDELKTFKSAVPTFKGYMGFPAASCISLNSEVVHGIPRDVKFKSGDLVSIDFGVTLKGWIGDAAKTFIVGEPCNEKDIKLISETKRALESGVKQMVIGNRLYDINRAIEQVASENGYGNLRDFSGHSVSTVLHEKPHVFNYVNLDEPNIRLQEGLVLALEPMFTSGSRDVNILDDKWTVATKDNSNAAHWEYSVAITKDGPKILGK